MPEVETQLRDYLEAVSPPIELEELEGFQPVRVPPLDRRTSPRLLPALAAAVLTLVALALLATYRGILAPETVVPPATQPEGDPGPPVPAVTIPGPEMAPPGAFDGLVLGALEGIGVVRDGRLVPHNDQCCALTALGDGGDGVLYQRFDEPGVIWWQSAPGEAPVRLVEADLGQRVSLEDVAVIEGEVWIIDLRFEPARDGETTTLLRRNLRDGRLVEVATLEEGLAVDRVSDGASRYLVSYRVGTESWFEFLDQEGRHLEVPTNPRSSPAPSLVGQGVLDRDGQRMVYVERDPEALEGGRADLVVYDLEAGQEMSRLRVVDLGDRVVFVELPRVVISRQRANPALPPVMLAFHLESLTFLSPEGGMGVLQP